MRVNDTALAGSASAFFETKRRPRTVAAHSVELSLGARLIQPTLPPARVPRADDVSDGSPSFSQSPHTVPAVNVPVNRLQFESRWSRGPPSSFVRHTCVSPANIVPCTVGSVMIGK